MLKTEIEFINNININKDLIPTTFKDKTMKQQHKFILKNS